VLDFLLLEKMPPGEFVKHSEEDFEIG